MLVDEDLYLNRESRRPHIFIVPEGFDATDFLPKSLRRRMADAEYVVNVIMRRYANWRYHDNDDFVVYLNAAILREIMAFRDYAKVMTALREAGVIERVENYVVGEHSFGFRLSTRYLSVPHERRPVTDRRMIRRLDQCLSRMQSERARKYEPIHWHLAELQWRLRIDGDEARRELATLPPTSNPYDSQGVLIRCIERGEYRVGIGECGRMSNNITSLNRRSRKCLHADGDSLVGLDLKGAQPALAALLMLRMAPAAAIAPDAIRYRELVQDGVFYEAMLEHLSMPKSGRDDLKRLFLRDVLAKRGYYYSAVEEAFREHYPTPYAFIRHINRDGHERLIRLLQQEEAEFVIKRVAADVAGQSPKAFMVTLHDSILTTPRNVGIVRRAFERGFRDINFPMQLKVGDVRAAI